MTMTKASYTKLAIALESGGGFVKKSQADLKAKVIGFAEASLKYYKDTRDSKHILNGTMALTQYNEKWVRAYHKAAKDLVAIHSNFVMTVLVNTDTDFKVNWKHDKIAKDKRPQHLPSLDRVVREMVQAWEDQAKPKAKRTDDQIKAGAIKRTITAMFDIAAQTEAVDNMGIEDLRAVIANNAIVTTRAEKALADKLPKGVKAPVKKRTPKAKAKRVAVKRTTAKALDVKGIKGSVGKAMAKAAKAA